LCRWWSGASHLLHQHGHAQRDDSNDPLKDDEDHPNYGTHHPVPDSHQEGDPLLTEHRPATGLLSVKPMTKMLVLFFGLFFHNIFVGIALGIADGDYALLIAITFHQFFEGLGMGSRVALAGLGRFFSVLAIDVVFAASAPAGIGLGLVFKSSLTNDSTLYMALDGVFQGISGGILVYVALVHMIRAYAESAVGGEVDDGKAARAWEWHKWASFLGVLCGAAAMAIIGIWA